MEWYETMILVVAVAISAVGTTIAFLHGERNRRFPIRKSDINDLIK